MRSAAIIALTTFLLAASQLSGCSPRGYQETKELRRARAEMADRVSREQNITDKRIIAALRTTPRQEFLPEDAWPDAYSPQPAIAAGASQVCPPCLVAHAVGAMQPMPEHRLLIVNPPSGYAAAVASKVCKHVTVLVVSDQQQAAMSECIQNLEIGNVQVEACDIARGWGAGAPYDSALISGGFAKVPEPILDQLDDDGVVVLVGGPFARELRVMRLVERDLSAPTIITMSEG